MNTALTLVAPNVADFSLKTITSKDLGDLREWKNANRQWFFYQELIDPEQQQRWFEGYCQRPADFMFMVWVGGNPIGCMGIRLVGEEWDIYNVILGDLRRRGSGAMSRALSMVCRYATGLHDVPVGLRVLSANPARGWYLKNGFRFVEGNETFHVLRLESQHFDHVAIEATGFRET